jgi:copper(I)-binding protein
MKMRELPDGIAVPAQQTVELKPGGLHVMLMGLKHPLVEGETFPLTLEFEHAGTLEVEVTIAGIAARDTGHGGMDHSAAPAKH